ncbi:hypothetical protein [Phaeospirillum tilakii]|uniref:Uncharacterized protein n=1 Tax=Phaeospirillum tilakii TaxID=741673 RepID=A0ABW5CAT9_9PROT
MDFRRFAVPVVVSLVVGGVVYGLSLAGQQSLRAEIEQIKQLKGEADRRFADVDALVSRVESIDHRVSSVEKTLPASAAAPAEEPAPAAAAAAAAPAPAPAEPAAPAPAPCRAAAPAAAPAPDKP